MASRYRFDDVEIDTQSFRLLKAGKVVQVEPKTLNLLIYLIENRGRLLERRETIDAVWRGAFVADHILNRTMGQLRKGLGDDAREPRYIETVPTRGYRFIAQVEGQIEREDGSETATSPIRVAEEPLTPPNTLPAAKLGKSRLMLPSAAVAVVVLACGMIVALALVRGRSRFEYCRPGHAVQITSSPGLSIWPTFSPDGTAVAYASDGGKGLKGLEIFVRGLAPGSREVRITSDGGENLQPAWSPDGKLIAYYSYRRRGIWLVPPFGGPSRQLTDFGSRPAWSPDNQWIAFSSGAAEAIRGSAIWAIRPDGTGMTQITSARSIPGSQSQRSASWSPDGKYIVFESVQNSGTDIWSIMPDGKGLVCLSLASVSPGSKYDPIYSPDGKSVVFAGDSGLWQIRIDPQTSAPLGQPVQITNGNGSEIENWAFSRDGKKLLYANLGWKSTLMSLSLSPSGRPMGEPVPLTPGNGFESSLPAFSPDGARVAFYSRGAGSDGQIWLMNADGSNIQQLTSDPSSYFTPPAWYPDGKHVLYFSAQNGRSRFFSIDSDTLQQQLVAELHQPIDRFALSPDGTQLAFGSPAGNIWNVWLRELATGKMKQITHDQESIGWPRWSPDGKLLSADLSRGQETNIVVFPADESRAAQLTFDHGYNWSGGWSPDGDKIILAKRPPGESWNVWTVSRSTSTEKQITHYSQVYGRVYSPVMSPRGDQLVYALDEVNGNIWMLELEHPQ